MHDLFVQACISSVCLLVRMNRDLRKQIAGEELSC